LSKSAQAYEQIKAAILYAQFRPGDVTSIRILARMLGTSTMPVREAVTRLITERALELLPNRGLRVPYLSSDQARDIFRARRALEGIAAELAASEITSAELRQLAEHEADLEAALRKRDLEKAVRHNIQFHLQMYRASRSETLVTLIEALYLRYAPTLYIVMDLIPGRNAEKTLFVRQHHIAILTALNAHDGRAARAALERDLSDAIQLEGFLTKNDMVGRIGVEHGITTNTDGKMVRPKVKKAASRARNQVRRSLGSRISLATRREHDG
jgi:DNA-binding GntR family transcriptional regulator